jgi:uncharacterized membrane protein HdeD (DUF308 family)
MRFRPLDRTDASRVMQQTLYMRGGAIVALAVCGLQWPDLALPIVLAHVGAISVLFALADGFVAAAIRRESSRSARKIGALGLLGLGFGAITLVMPALPVPQMLAAVLLWLVASGGAVMVWGASLPRRERANCVITEWGAVQVLLAFLLLVLHPTTATAVRHATAGYAVSLGAAQIALGLWLRRRDNARGYAIAAV